MATIVAEECFKLIFKASEIVAPGSEITRAELIDYLNEQEDAGRFMMKLSEDARKVIWRNAL